MFNGSATLSPCIAPAGRRIHQSFARYVVVVLLLATACIEAPFVGPEEEAPAAPGALFVQTLDPFGAPVAGARVDAVSFSGSPASRTTDAQGVAEFYDITAGSYTVTASRQGFEVSSASASVSAGSASSVQIALDAATLPTALVVGARVVSWSSSFVEFETDVAVSDGTRVTDVSPTVMTIDPFSSLSFNQLSGFQANASMGPSSTVLLFDQSGSIQSTDPGDSRLQAAKYFLDAAGRGGDDVVVAAFSSGGRLPYEPVTIWGSFTTNGRSFFGNVDALADLEGGGTPLYAATASMANYVATNGTRPNRAVLVFTDGMNTDAGTLDMAVDAARARNVRLYMVGLSQQVDIGVLGEMADRTGGAVIWAADARQLVSYYRTLGAILRGEAAVQRVRWRVNESSGAFGRGSWFSTSVAINTSNGRLYAPFRVSIP